MLLACACLAEAGCASGPAAGPARRNDIAGLEASRWTWVDAACVDGPLALAGLGFERELRVEAAGAAMLFTYDDALSVRGCTRSAVWRVTREDDQLRLEPQAFVTLPVAAACGPEATAPLRGTSWHDGETLEIVEQRSPWCRGLDARFVYRRLASVPLDPAAVARRWVAHFDRRDADTLARMFSRDGTLIEPFSPTDDGAYRRHQGRPQVRAWLESVFASTPWSALRLTGIDATAQSSELSASWEYMDANLAEPVAGRSLFVVATGEIFETELQLLGIPRARADAEIVVPFPPGDAREVPR